MHAGKPFVFVSGNHDSDTLSRALARRGAIVLTQRGRLLPGGRHGPVVVRVGGLRVAGYSDPFERRRADGYRALKAPNPSERQKERVLVVVGPADRAHRRRDGAFARAGADRAGAPSRDPAPGPLVFLVGHTHEQACAISVR